MYNVHTVYRASSVYSVIIVYNVFTVYIANSVLYNVYSVYSVYKSTARGGGSVRGTPSLLRLRTNNIAAGFNNSMVVVARSDP